MTLDAQDLMEKARAWWRTDIIDIRPGQIGVRGYPIEDLIGRLSFAEMIWLMVRGDVPKLEHAQLLEAALVASVDHGPHAPSIAVARMSITCGIDLNNAMASAVNVLGDVHGGAGQQCMELYEIVHRLVEEGGSMHDAVEQALDRFIAAHGKIIPGFGHRFHPVDPRVAPLLDLVKVATDSGHVKGDFAAIGVEVERALQRRTGRSIPMNIDGVTAVIFSELGFPAPLGRGLFILSRSVGILAHAWEQNEQGHRMKGPMPKEIPYTYAGPARRTLGPRPPRK